MALEPGAARLSISPTNSGRASPTSRKLRSRRGEDELHSKDKAFRRYASGVERSLSIFDTTLDDWADYISFLGRLLKSLQGHPANITVIPSKGIVARRLSQCLNPTLPAGVHQKALEVYGYIFAMIGREALSQDLPLYLPGLSATLSFASLSVRSPFLSLLESYLLDLDPSALRPALKAIVLALLPGLEDETSEDFERTLKLLNDFKLTVKPKGQDDQNRNSGDEYFWQCFFLASITSNGRRLGALAYLTRYLPKLGSLLRRTSVDANANGHSAEDFEDPFVQVTDMVTSPEPGLILRCFAAGLGDEQLLIQRGFLDLLVTHLPLHSKVLQKRVKSDDLELLLAAAAGVVTRRDMSLNRRLWTWLLGPEPSHGTDGDGGADSPSSIIADPMNSMSSPRTVYFETYGLQPLTKAILRMILRDHLTPLERAKPFRICLSLMDRWEIGGLVVPEIFLPIINSVRRYQEQSTTKSDFKEVLRSASVFFDGVESGLIWGEIIGQIAEAIGPNKSSIDLTADKLSLVKFILFNFNVREDEMLMIHAPLASLTILAMIDDTRIDKLAETSPKIDERGIVSRVAVEVAVDLVELIPERALQLRSSANQLPSHETQPPPEIETSNILERIRTFYVQDQGNLDISPPPFTTQDVCELLHREAGRIFCQSLDKSMPSADIAVRTRLLVTLLTKSPKVESLDVENSLLSIQMKLSTSEQIPFSIFSSIVSFVTILYPRYISIEQFSGLIDPLVRLAWSFLSASCPKYHVEAVRGLWQLQTALSLSNHDIESSICNIITEYEVTGTFASQSADRGRSFGILWTHTLQDNAGSLDRRGSKPLNVESRSTFQTSGIGTFEVMLGRPLFLLLDALLDERTQLFVAVRTWLQSLTAVDRLFHLLIAKFAEFEFLQTAVSETESKAGTLNRPFFTQEDDLDQCLYYLQKLSNILRWSPDSTWAAMARNTISTDATHRSLHLISGRDDEISIQEFFVHVCLRAVIGGCNSEDSQLMSRINQFQRAALSVLHQILLNPYSSPLSGLQLENQLIDRLTVSLDEPDPFIQVALLDVVFAAMKLKGVTESQPLPSPSFENKKVPPQDPVPGPGLTIKLDRPEKFLPSYPPPPLGLVKCLQAGFAASSSRSVLDSWTSFLSEVLPFYSESIFQVLIPLVETLCGQVAQTFTTLQKTFRTGEIASTDSTVPESTLLSLLNGLEQVLARGHERLVKDEAKTPAVKSPDQPQGFFGNMVSGVFSTESPQTRNQTANNRLTVLLSFQDAARICFTIWSWGGRGPEGSNQDAESAASFSYTSLRMRNRARRLLEHLFAAEPLECLETVVEIWQRASLSIDSAKYTSVFNLLHVLDGSKPKHTIPAIFDAIYSRTNPNALDPSRKSTLTSSLLDTDLAVFLVEYAKSLEDDAMDEIWTDCMAFLKDILSNPFPHRQTLPSLLEFAAILGEKVDNTNFGEQRRMRKELGDLFLRLLTAIFTTRPIGFSENSAMPIEKQPDVDDRNSSRQATKSGDVVGILASIVPNLPKILVDPERVFTAANTISMSVIGPTFRSKSYPENVTKNVLVLLYQLTRLPNIQKSWKKDISDAFNDARFFANPFGLLESDWLPLLRHWTLSDKDRMPELLSRLTPPATAGIVFGVGATSARLEADRKTQVNLRRIATLILASADDTFVAELVPLEEKLIELLSATPTSSPSSTTRAEIYILLRVVVLKTSPIHLAFLWPTINAELYSAISSVISADHSQSADTYNNFAVLQACKLLDTLLCIAPDDFQLNEWLFVTDTIDAVYRPPNFQPVGLIDELAEELGSTMVPEQNITTDKSTRRPLLGPGGVDCSGVSLERREELVGKVLRPFFGQLSSFAYQSTYEMGPTDWVTCRRGVLADLFDETGIVKAL